MVEKQRDTHTFLDQNLSRNSGIRNRNRNPRVFVAKKMICTWQGRQTRTETKAKLNDAAGGTRNVALYFGTANKEFIFKIKKKYFKII